MSVGTASRLDKLLNLIEGKPYLLRLSESISRVEHAACGAVRCIEGGPDGTGGATSAICKAAARQVASTARSHPQQLAPLLQKVHSLCNQDPLAYRGSTASTQYTHGGGSRTCNGNTACMTSVNMQYALHCRCSLFCNMLGGRRVLQRASA